MVTRDHHAIYKNGAKEIADRYGKSLTFMAKYDERQGNSRHVHLSLRDSGGAALFDDGSRPYGMSPTFCRFLAGCWPPA